MGRSVLALLSCLFFLFLSLDNYLYAEIDFKLGKIYEGENLKEIAFPLGGFGAGQVYVKGNGKISPWEIVNNFNSNANVSDSFFAIFINNYSKGGDAKLLQINPLFPAPGIEKIQFKGEFPFAQLKFLDFLPNLEITMDTFSPFIPLDVQNSSLPLVFFIFTLENKTNSQIKGTLLGTVPNLIGWDGGSELLSSDIETPYSKTYCIKYPEFEGNKNSIIAFPDSSFVYMENEYSGEDKFEKNIKFVTNQYESAHALRYTKNVDVYYSNEIDIEKSSDDGTIDIFWLGSSETLISDTKISKLNERIQNGGYLVLNGGENSIFHWVYAFENSKNKKRSYIFDDFESGSYRNWTILGDAFGEKPAEGKFQNQSEILGKEGKFFINSYNGDDRKTGKAISKDFYIEHSFLTIKIGGGKKLDTLYVALYVEGKKVKTTTGDNTESLKKVIWNISEYNGKKGHLEIVDNDSEGWGHILVDEIIFTNELPLNKNSINILKSWLPLKDLRGRIKNETISICSKELDKNLFEFNLQIQKFFEFSNIRYTKNSVSILNDKNGSPLLLFKKIGKGGVLWCNGDLTKWGEGLNRRDIITSIISRVTQNNYEYHKGYSPSHILWGNMCFGVLKPTDNVAITPQWRDFYKFWEKFSVDGSLIESESTSSADRFFTWNTSIGYKFDIKPKGKESVIFVLSWYFPNRTRHSQYFWKLRQLKYDYRLGNYYNNLFNNSLEVAKYGISNYDYLYSNTEKFHKCFYSSNLPPVVLEAIGANIATIHSPIYIFLEDGTVGGFEGTDGCCPMNCTHVYNYAQALPYLFPQLEQRIRFQELTIQVDKSEWYIPHRFVVPPTEPQLKNEIGGPFHHALDGELGTLLKLYREYRISGDKRSIEPLIHPAVKVLKHILKYHDPDGEGIIRGEQPNTYDTHLYGSNTFIGTLYLSTLKAMEQLLTELNYPDSNLIEECRRRFNLGREKYIEKCWNGEYFINLFDAPNVGQEVYNQMNCYGPGCHSDQLLGQWWAHILDLGYLFPKDYIKKTLESIYKYNWRTNFYGHVQSPRKFAEDDEPGLLMCTWPKGGRPESPILYCDEVWTGIEYEVGGLMISEDMWDKAIEIVSGARSRYTGSRKNPFSEIECGGHYARAMSSYAMLILASGFQYDNGTLKVNPRIPSKNGKFFFSTGKGWGYFAYERIESKSILKIYVEFGELELSKILLPTETNLTGICVVKNKKFQFPTKSYAVSKFEDKEYDTIYFRIEFPAPIVIGEQNNYLEIELR